MQLISELVAFGVRSISWHPNYARCAVDGIGNHIIWMKTCSAALDSVSHKWRFLPFECFEEIIMFFEEDNGRTSSIFIRNCHVLR